LAFRSVGVVVGLAAEARIARRLGWLVATGGGTSLGAEAAARWLIDAGSDALISFGLAGGLDPSLRPGALVVPATVVARGERYGTDHKLSQRLGGSIQPPTLGADTVAASAAEKRRLHNETSAIAVDLESGAVARVARAHDKPFAVLRAVCDPADRDLPPAALATLDGDGVIGFSRLLTALAAQPTQVPALLRLAADAAAAGGRRRAPAPRGAGGEGPPKTKEERGGGGES
jgi:adenosylhomocysteine nucleosidase